MLFRFPVRVERHHLAPDVSNVIGDRMVPVAFAFMVINYQTEGDDQFYIAVIVSRYGVVVTFKPAYGIFLPPGHLRIISVYGVFPSPMPVYMIDIRTAVTLIMHFPP